MLQSCQCPHSWFPVWGGAKQAVRSSVTDDRFFCHLFVRTLSKQKKSRGQPSFGKASEGNSRVGLIQATPPPSPSPYQCPVFMTSALTSQRLWLLHVKHVKTILWPLPTRERPQATIQHVNDTNWVFLFLFCSFV